MVNHYTLGFFRASIMGIDTIEPIKASKDIGLHDRERGDSRFCPAKWPPSLRDKTGSTPHPYGASKNPGFAPPYLRNLLNKSASVITQFSSTTERTTAFLEDAGKDFAKSNLPESIGNDSSRSRQPSKAAKNQ